MGNNRSIDPSIKSVKIVQLRCNKGRDDYFKQMPRKNWSYFSQLPQIKLTEFHHCFYVTDKFKATTGLTLDFVMVGLTK